MGIKNVVKSCFRNDDYYKELSMPTLTSKYTRVMVEKEFSNNAPHDFMVVDAANEDIICCIGFQNGPIKEYGVNGVANEDLLNMVLCRLQHFQESPYACYENQKAAECIMDALSWLRMRTEQRTERGVEGTSEI